jgi:mono/diheme cytochrome c family protein
MVHVVSGPGKFRAFDKTNGKLLTEVDLSVGTTGGPMTYTADGRRMIIVPIGSRSFPGGWIALGLQSGNFSEAQAKLGLNLYRSKCAGCHGADLAGGEHAPALKGEAFWSQWDQETVRSLYSRIISTMPPDAPGSVANKVIDVVGHSKP